MRLKIERLPREYELGDGLIGTITVTDDDRLYDVRDKANVRQFARYIARYGNPNAMYGKLGKPYDNRDIWRRVEPRVWYVEGMAWLLLLGYIWLLALVIAAIAKHIG